MSALYACPECGSTDDWREDYTDWVYQGFTIQVDEKGEPDFQTIDYDGCSGSYDGGSGEDVIYKCRSCDYEIPLPPSRRELDEKALDELAKILRRPTWPSGADFLSWCADIVTRTGRDIVNGVDDEGNPQGTATLVVRVQLVNEDEEIRWVHSTGKTVDEAVESAERIVQETTSDDSWVMTDWEAA